jgi:Ca-activated chloride channel family protein
MSFLYPWVLALLVVPTSLLGWLWRRGGRPVVLPFDHGQAGSGRKWRIVLNCAESLPALLLAVVIVILAGPTRTSGPKTKRTMTNIEIAVDISGSMGWPFAGGTRYDVAMKSLDDFLTYRKGDAFGLTFFGNNHLHWVPLTTDVSAIRCAPALMQPGKTPPWFQGTEIARALRACRKVLAERQEGDRMILLISDGDSDDLWGGNDFIVAKDLKDHNIVMHYIHVSDQRVSDPITNITALTGGEVFDPADPEALKEVFKRIDKMQKTKLEKTVGDTMDFLGPFACAGLVLAGLALLAWYGLRYTPW